MGANRSRPGNGCCSVRSARPEDAERIAAVQLSTWRSAYTFLPEDALDVPLDQAAALWLRAIELTAFDKPGFWERYGYHNDADPWQEERYAF